MGGRVVGGGGGTLSLRGRTLCPEADGGDG